jgi:hypothetical protein
MMRETPLSSSTHQVDSMTIEMLLPMDIRVPGKPPRNPFIDFGRLSFWTCHQSRAFLKPKPKSHYQMSCYPGEDLNDESLSAGRLPGKYIHSSGQSFHFLVTTVLNPFITS